MVGIGRSLDKEDLKPPFDGFSGKYVTIRTREGVYGGKVNDIREGYVYLSPYQTGRYDCENGLELFISDESLRIKTEDVIAVHPTAEERIEAYCEFQNRQNMAELEIKRAERKKALSEK